MIFGTLTLIGSIAGSPGFRMRTAASAARYARSEQPAWGTWATSSQRLLRGDGSAAQVTLTNRYAYVSEKNGSLEAFALDRDGCIAGQATAVTGIAPGTIVGITGSRDLVVAPIAHLASDFNRAAITVSGALSQLQLVSTKEIAACWAANDDGEVCVTNPGSMTVSCGRLGADGFESYTRAAANLVGESAFDLDIRDGLVGFQAVRAGAPVLLTYSRRNRSDFLPGFAHRWTAATRALNRALRAELPATGQIPIQTDDPIADVTRTIKVRDLRHRATERLKPYLTVDEHSTQMGLFEQH
jgi:hypothetical protein